MKKVLAPGMAAMALAIGVAGATAATNPNTLTLAVFGDSPYLDPSFAPHAEFNATPAFIDTINADSRSDSAAVTHSVWRTRSANRKTTRPSN